MPRASDGTVTLPVGNPVVAGTAASADVVNNTIADLAAMIEDCYSITGKNAVITNPWQIPVGTVSEPGLAFQGDLNTGIYRSAADELAITAGGGQKIRADSAGAHVTGTLDVSGATTIGGAVAVTGNTTITGNLAVTGTFTVTATGTWNAMPAYSGTWGAASGYGGATPGYSIDSAGIVRLRGPVNSGAGAVTSTLCTLPEGFRPTQSCRFPIIITGGSGYSGEAIVDSSGIVQLYAAPTYGAAMAAFPVSNTVFLDVIQFPTW